MERILFLYDVGRTGQRTHGGKDGGVRGTVFARRGVGIVFSPIILRHKAPAHSLRERAVSSVVKRFLYIKRLLQKLSLQYSVFLVGPKTLEHNNKSSWDTKYDPILHVVSLLYCLY